MITKTLLLIKKNIKISLKDSGWDNQLLIGLVLLQKWIKLEFLLMKKVKDFIHVKIGVGKMNPIFGQTAQIIR